jgi:hypothetical protein
MKLIVFFSMIGFLLVQENYPCACAKESVWDRLVSEIKKSNNINRLILRQYCETPHKEKHAKFLNFYHQMVSVWSTQYPQELQCFKELLAKLEPTELERRDCQGLRLLDLAIRYRLIVHAAYLLDAGSNPNISAFRYDSILSHVISEVGGLGIDALTVSFLELLISHGVDVNGIGKQGSTALIQSIRRFAQPAIIHYLLKKVASVDQFDKHNCTALFYAAREGTIESLHALLKAKPCCGYKNTFGRTPLHEAARSENSCILSCLLEYIREDTERINKSILTLALANHTRVGGKSPANVLTTFILQMIRDFLQPVDINAVDNDGNSALHLACSSGRSLFENMLLLIQEGGNSALKNKQGESPVEYAYNKHN